MCDSGTELSHSSSLMIRKRMRERAGGKEGLSESIFCTQLYDEMRFYPFLIVKVAAKLW